MQEEINHKTIALAVTSSKMTARVLATSIRMYLKYQHNKSPKVHKGKQTLKQLVAQNASLSNIEITDKNIRAFQSTARKYEIDYALKKDTSCQPPKYIVFFKGKDVDVINMGLREFADKMLKSKEKVSVKDAIVKASYLLKTHEHSKEKARDIPR